MFSEPPVLLHLHRGCLQELPVLLAVHSVVLDQHEHVAPAVVAVFLHFFVLGLQFGQLPQVLLFNGQGTAFVLVGGLPVGVAEEGPVGVESPHKVLLDDLQDDALLLALLASHLDHFSQRGKNQLLLLVGYVSGF